MNTDYLPNLTDPAGQVLTTADWAETGVHIASCDLAALLVKPGITTLSKLSTLKHYWSWPGEILLNLSSLPLNKQGVFQVHSTFDGRTLRFTQEDILKLIEQLKPDYLTCSDEFKPLISKHFQNYQHDLKVNNQPSEDALNGIIYTHNNIRFNIQKDTCTNDFWVLGSSCKCPACAAELTRAYFHHLYVHTPLLCQRWLIMHNQWITHHS
ncbi:MAG: hypothetical protein K0U24_00200 [Gammaproteobacteria bacterium]|nr:hypothetical protein [Gammaproteobacteria bacterium]MCH9762648.1 hypothetical protein [Gammaproteobacteria bacterium]